jgi:hypothetical protein
MSLRLQRLMVLEGPLQHLSKEDVSWDDVKDAKVMIQHNKRKSEVGS